MVATRLVKSRVRVFEALFEPDSRRVLLLELVGKIGLAGFGLAQRAGDVGELTLERVARGLDASELGLQIRLARIQALDVGPGGLIVAPHRVKSRLSGFEPLFERRPF